jgi:hypothetical protein
MEHIISDIEVVDWLLVHINDKVDWNNPFRQEEFLKLKEFVADSTMQPLDCVTVSTNTDGGRLFNKLRILAKEERLKEVETDIQLIRFDKYKNLNKAKGTALAALDYAKSVHANRPKVVGVGYLGAVFTCSSQERLDNALEQHKKFRTRVRVSLNKVSYK